ncbi:23769_t:CDS:1 [Dentiscutata erythropus]|uniref:23769_t:CDS:1 n=1 Tax=Dentiscutata erythropus TaxID=1348616 RepID=A0A9N9GNM4_9GLOM|nr:23769_t:CDS:1 [Dentiscutata erythropus]
MAKTKLLSKKQIKSQRKRHTHYFKTVAFKDKLRLSIENNIRDFISNKDFNFKHSIEQLLAPCKKTRGKRGRITRPQNAFILYRKDNQDEIKKENPDASFEQISKIIGEQWANASDETKNRYILLAKLCSRVHHDIFPDYKFEPRLKRGEKKKSSTTPRESIEESSRPWSPLSSIMVLSEPQPSLDEQTFSPNINIPQESYGVINVSQEMQETQFTTEAQSLIPMTELIDLFQSSGQFSTDQITYPNYHDYEAQSTDENVCVNTTLPLCFDENASIDTTSTFNFIHNIPQDLNSYSISNVNPDSFLFDTTFLFDSFESTDEQLYNIFDLTNI